MSSLQITLDLRPLIVLLLRYEGDEVDLAVAFLLLDDQNVTTIHRCDQDALGSKQIVVSILILGLLNLLNNEWEILTRHLFHNRLVYEVLLRLNSLNPVDSFGNLIVALLPQDLIILC